MAETPPTVRGGLNEDGPDTLLVVVIAFLVPGAGHALIGLLRRGVAFFAIVALTFSTGLLLSGRLYEPDLQNLLSVVATIASHGSGVFDIAARFAGWSGDMQARTYEYGTAFILTAGLMNLLLVFDVWERLSSEPDDGSEPEEGMTSP